MRDKNSTKSRVVSSKNEIVSKSKEYDELAQKGQLGTLREYENIKGGATKSDMLILYDQNLPVKNKVDENIMMQLNFLRRMVAVHYAVKER